MDEHDHFRLLYRINCEQFPFINSRAQAIFFEATDPRPSVKNCFLDLLEFWNHFITE